MPVWKSKHDLSCASFNVRERLLETFVREVCGREAKDGRPEYESAEVHLAPRDENITSALRLMGN